MSLSLIYFFQKWGCHLKENPYYPQKAAVWSDESIMHIYDLNCSNSMEIADKACVCLMISTGMRTIDIRNMNSNMIEMITPKKKTPRHY